MKTLWLANVRGLVSLVVLAAACDPLQASPADAVPRGKSNISLTVQYQAGTEPLEEALVPGPLSQSTKIHLDGEGAAVLSKMTSTPYISGCSKNSEWITTKVDMARTGIEIAFKASLGTFERMPSNSVDAARVSVEMTVSKLLSIKTARSDDCAIGLPEVRATSLSESIPVPLDGSAVSRTLENGGKLTLSLSTTND